MTPTGRKRNGPCTQRAQSLLPHVTKEKEQEHHIMYILENQKILTQQQQRKAILGMFGNFKNIFRERAVTY